MAHQAKQRVINELKRLGWIEQRNNKHMIFKNCQKPGTVIVICANGSKDLSPGAIRDLRKKAGIIL